MFKFPLIVDGLDVVPEEFQGLYAEQENGKFKLVDALAKLVKDEGGKKKTIENLRKKETELQELLDSLGDFTIDDLKAAAEELQEIKDKIEAGELTEGDDQKIEEIVAKRTQRMQDRHKKDLEKKDSEIQKRDEGLATRDKKISSLTVDRDLKDAAIAAGVQSHSIDDAMRAGREVFSVNDEFETSVRENSGYESDFTPQQFFEEHKSSRPWFMDLSNQGAGNVGSDGGGPGPSGMKALENAKSQKEFEKQFNDQFNAT